MIETDLEYYERRLEQEREQVHEAASPEAASVHRTLVLIYAEEVRRLRPLMPLKAVAAA